MHNCHRCNKPITSCTCPIPLCKHGEVLSKSTGRGIACYFCLEEENTRLKEENKLLIEEWIVRDTTRLREITSE